MRLSSVVSSLDLSIFRIRSSRNLSSFRRQGSESDGPFLKPGAMGGAATSGRHINLNHLTIYSVNALTALNETVEPS